MKYRAGPFLGLNFYFADLPEAAALSRVVYALADLGVETTGEGFAHVGPDAAQPFGFPHEWPRERFPLELADLDAISAHPEMRPVGVFMLDAGGLGDPDMVEYVGYVGISQDAAAVDKHPIGIDTDADPFQPDADPLRARALGQRVMRRFLDVVERTHPSYAAIPVLGGLQCPTDLARGATNYNFRDFYVSEAFVGEDHLDTIQDLYLGAHCEAVADGVYISCSAPFNPDSVEFPDYLARQPEIARIIAFVAGQELP